MKKHIDKILIGITVAGFGATAVIGGVFGLYHPNTVGPQQANRDKILNELMGQHVTMYGDDLVGIYSGAESTNKATHVLVQGMATKVGKNVVAPAFYKDGIRVNLTKANSYFSIPFIDGKYHVEVMDVHDHDVANWYINIDSDNNVQFLDSTNGHINKTIGSSTGSGYIGHDATNYKLYKDILTSFNGINDSKLIAAINNRLGSKVANFTKITDTTTKERNEFKEIGTWGIDKTNVNGLIKSQLKSLANKKAAPVLSKTVHFSNGKDSFTLVQSNTGIDATAGRHYSEALAGQPFSVLGAKIDPVAWAWGLKQRNTVSLGISFKYTLIFDKDSLKNTKSTTDRTLNTDSTLIKSAIETILQVN